MIKSILSLSAFTIILSSCIKDKNATLKPYSDEYFSFEANGVHYDYPQEKGTSLFTGNWSTLSAGPVSATVGYQIYASSLKDPAAEGEFIFSFSNNSLPDRDTIILDGISNKVAVHHLINDRSNFSLKPPLIGRIIFNERSAQRLSGSFEFKAYQYVADTVGIGNIYLDTVLHITNGEFSIIP